MFEFYVGDIDKLYFLKIKAWVKRLNYGTIPIIYWAKLDYDFEEWTKIGLE